MIAFANPSAQYLAHQKEIDAAIANVLAKGVYILGEEVGTFEKEFSAYLALRETIGVANGTDALMLALKALNIGAGDEVILPSMTATPTAAAISQVGATPIFADVDPRYYTLDPESVLAKITSKTKAIIAVHFYGQPADMHALQKMAADHHLKLIEDCAQAMGARYHGKSVGHFSDVACFSFFPTKNLGAIGDGGAVATNNLALALRIRMLAQYGWDKERSSQFPGFNSRLDELQAAILRVKLRYLDHDTQKRNDIANFYNNALKGLPIVLPAVRNNVFHAFHLYVIQSENRNELVKKLHAQNIMVGVHYAKAVHQMPAYFNEDNKLPVSENLASAVISLPMYPELTLEQQKTVEETFLKLF
ncbi:MAG: DegT/DnrJ/EryC1/StrS family aminotransferase [Gammaproteobacteria bacterium]|nr:DegT/DnrJ/EryC1/StrS family aminotransferase [Gammaproteobacteria bacterium]